jgi:two-component system osmolarity sensor histidine kinase EnvZ
VAPDLLDRLGQPFLRGDAARGSAGSGLGLSIAARCAQMHGGHLTLRNGESGGFLAQITLPCA